MEFPEMDEDFQSEGTSSDEELEEPKKTLEPGFFKYYSDDATDLFRQYFKAIKKNRYLLKLIDDTSQLDHTKNPCYLSTTASVTDSRDHYKDRPLPRLSGEEQEDNPGASEKIHLTQMENKGRGFKAVSEIKAGENVIVEKAIVFMIPPNCKCKNYPHFSCHHCAAPVFKFVTCEHCDICVFCDEKCYAEAWESYHQFECHAMQLYYFGKAYVAMGFRMMLACLNKKNTETTSDSTEKFEILHGLETHMSKYTTDDLNILLHEAASFLVYLIEKTDFFKKMLLIRSKKQCKPYYMYMYTGGLLLRFMCAARVGIVQIPINNALDYPGINSGHYPAYVASKNATMLNHSCVPNCFVMHNKDYVIVRAITDIKPDEELTIFYLPMTYVFSSKARALESSRLFFECVCNRCTSDELEELNTFICRVCNGKCNICKTPPRCLDCNSTVDPSLYLKLESDAESLYNEFKTTKDIQSLNRYLKEIQRVYSPFNFKLHEAYEKVQFSYLNTEDHFRAGCYLIIKSLAIYGIHVNDLDLHFASLRCKAILYILHHKNFPKIKWQPDDIPLLEKLIEVISSATKVLIIYYETDELKFPTDDIRKICNLIKKLRVNHKEK